MLNVSLKIIAGRKKKLEQNFDTMYDVNETAKSARALSKNMTIVSIAYIDSKRKPLEMKTNNTQLV